MLAFRVADRRHTIFDPAGAALHGGRWNSPGRGVMYAAQTYAGALMEVLVHAILGAVPKNHGVITIAIPDDLPVEHLAPGRIDIVDTRQTRSYGDGWLSEKRTAILSVASFVLQGREQNILINPAHPDFGRIVASEPEAVIWDERLFSGG